MAPMPSPKIEPEGRIDPARSASADWRWTGPVKMEPAQEQAALAPLFEAAEEVQEQPAKPSQRKSRPLQRAVATRDPTTIKLVLGLKELLGVNDRDIGHAFNMSTRACDLDMLRLLAEYVYDYPLEGENLETELVWYGHTQKQEELVNLALELAQEKYSKRDFENFVFDNRTKLARYNNGGIVSRKVLLGDFLLATERGEERIVARVLQSGQQHLLETRDLDRALELSAKHARAELLVTYLEARSADQKAAGREDEPSASSSLHASIIRSIRSLFPDQTPRGHA